MKCISLSLEKIFFAINFRTQIEVSERFSKSNPIEMQYAVLMFQKKSVTLKKKHSESLF